MIEKFFHSSLFRMNEKRVVAKIAIATNVENISGGSKPYLRASNAITISTDPFEFIAHPTM